MKSAENFFQTIMYPGKDESAAEIGSRMYQKKETRTELQFNYCSIKSTWTSQESQNTNKNVEPMLRTNYCVPRPYWLRLGEERCAKAILGWRSSITTKFVEREKEKRRSIWGRYG